MKKTRLQKKSRSKQKLIERELWKECRRIVREQFGNDCYTCKAKDLQGSNCQLGHVPWPKSVLGAYLKYDLRCLRYQCYNCNINHGGMGAEAYKRMLKEEGKVYMSKLERDRQVTVKAIDFYTDLLEYYKTVTL